MNKKNLIDLAVFISSAILMIVILILNFYLPKHGTVVYNCSIAEISPDIPLKVKEECRERNMKEIK